VPALHPPPTRSLAAELIGCTLSALRRQ